MRYFFSFLRKYFFLLFLAVAFISFFCLHLHNYLNLQTLKTYQLSVQAWTAVHYKSAVSIYILIFVILIACAIPCASVLSLLGGFLFGNIAILYAVIGTTVGGIGLYLAVRTAFSHRHANKSAGWIKTMEHTFKNNAFNYLLSLRLVPVFPCSLSNIAAGMLNIPIKIFIGATILGILPATIVYVLAGRGLDKILTGEHKPILDIIFQPTILFPLLCLAVLSVFPVLYKSVKKYKQRDIQ